MNRVSSATGFYERDLNNTLVFASQDRIPALPLLFATILAIVGQTGCRRAVPSRASDSVSAEARRAAEALPQRVAPALPPLLPPPEAVARSAGAHSGGAVKVHLDSEPLQLNPLGEADAAALQVVMGLVYEPLLECPSPGQAAGASGGDRLDYGPNYRPMLAEGWQVSPDGLRVTLYLRGGVKWHDGHAFNVLDVQASLEPLLLAASSGSATLRASLQDVASIELTGDRQVRLVLKRPSDFALRALCDIAILPDHLLRGRTADPAALARQPVGTGPFRFVAWERGKRIRLARVAGYWGGPAPLDEIAFEIDLDGARALMRTRRGEIDVLPRVLPVHYPDEVDPVTLHGALSLVRLRPERWAYVAVNHRRAPLDEAHFRRALSALWDRERFARDLHQGLAHPIGAPPFAGLPAAPAGRDRAAAEMDAGGYRDSNADGVRDVAGTPFRETLLIGAGARTAATEAQAFVFEARKAGLLIDPVVIDPAILLARVRKGDFDLALMQWEGRPDEDPSSLFGATGPFNFAAYRSAQVDALLDSIRVASGPAARAPLLATLGGILASEQPLLFLYQFDVPALVATRLHGVAAVAGHLDLRRAWVEP